MASPRSDRDEFNLLMVGGDEDTAAGKEGPFYYTLAEFSQYWTRIDVLTPGTREIELFGNVTLHGLQRPAWLRTFDVIASGRPLLSARDYSLVVSHDYSPFLSGIGAYLLARRARLPFISEVMHVRGYPRAASLSEHFFRESSRLYFRWMGSRASAIRVINDVELPTLLQKFGVPKSKILVLYAIYIDVDVFSPVPSEKKYDVVACGRLAVNKGYPLLLEATARLIEVRPQTRLAIVGDGPLMPRLRKLASRLGIARNVDFLGWLATNRQVAETYRQSKVMAFCSYNEGGPRVTVEAMACGLPVVSTPVGVMPEILKDGENGFLFRWDADELRHRLRLLLDDELLRERMGAKAALTGRRFEKSAVIRRYAQTYRQLAQDLRDAATR